jgi:hypothetical protein
MKNIAPIFIFIALFAGLSYAQKPKPRRAVAKPAIKTAPAPAIDPGTVELRTYSNKTFNFAVTFPDSWLIPDNDFEGYMKKQGFDLSLKFPPGLSPQAKGKIQNNAKQLTVLLTAYKYVPGMEHNAFVRISVEDLKNFPQVRDAVDYIDAIRATFKSMPMPPGFKFSETQAEQLGAKQFAFIDTETKDDKRRLYATVRNGYALMFSITYTEKEDLEILREILTGGSFGVKISTTVPAKK